MKLHQHMRKPFLALAAAIAAAVAPTHGAVAQEVVSIRGEKVNMRAAPSSRAEVRWQLGSGYPLRVVGSKGSWLQVVDFENDKGWVARHLTSRTPHAIVKSPTAHIRSGPGTRYKVLGKASYGEVFQVTQRRAGWVRVKVGDSGAGWIARSLLWGR